MYGTIRRSKCRSDCIHIIYHFTHHTIYNFISHMFWYDSIQHVVTCHVICYVISYHIYHISSNISYSIVSHLITSHNMSRHRKGIIHVQYLNKVSGRTVINSLVGICILVAFYSTCSTPSYLYEHGSITAFTAMSLLLVTLLALCLASNSHSTKIAYQSIDVSVCCYFRRICPPHKLHIEHHVTSFRQLCPQCNQPYGPNTMRSRRIKGHILINCFIRETIWLS